MKNLKQLDMYRVPFEGDLGDDYNGFFIIPRERNKYQVIASNGGGWEHVSICLLNNSNGFLERTPKWSEMCEVKDMFFEPEEAVMQLHPSASEYINEHPYVLHLWRPIELSLPIPPSYMVGYKKK